jgi:hypothetical protein
VIGAGFSEHPGKLGLLPEPFPSEREFWTCPKTGLKVPKRKDANLAWRERVLRDADNDPVLQADLLAACRDSGLLWVNLFGWTYWQFETDPKTGRSRPARVKHQPMITWECQDEAWEAFEEAYQTGEDVGVRKSRDMGASWLCMFFLHHKWLFVPDTQIREMSRTEDYVDGPTSKSLFWKHDYCNSWLAEWMRPPGVIEKGSKNRTKLRIHNELNNSTIAGESTTKHAMSGDRCSLLLLDEFAKVDNGEEIRTATADVTPCRIVNSTPAGAGTEYSRWMNSGQIRLVSLMFWDHPEKGAGRFVLQDPITKRYQISSPWLEHQATRRTPKELAQECYAEDLEAGDTFFDLNEIDKHIVFFSREPVGRYNIAIKERVADDDIADILRRRDTNAYTVRPASSGGKLEVWTELICGRPDQSKTYIFGIDTATGRGGSESVCSIRCKQSGEIIAKWKCRNSRPNEFARVIIALALWCGGANGQRLPFLVWEKNGPGLDLGKVLVKDYRYPFYFRTETVGTVAEKKSDKFGWHSSRDAKQLLLRGYERALYQGKCINHDKRGLEQMKYYIHFPDGSVGPAELQDKKQAERLLHGDIVIADALTTLDREVAQPKKKGIVAPGRSWGSRFEEWKKRKQNKTGWRKRFRF